MISRPAAAASADAWKSRSLHMGRHMGGSIGILEKKVETIGIESGVAW